MATQHQKPSHPSQSRFKEEGSNHHGGEDQQQADDCSATPAMNCRPYRNLNDFPGEILLQIFSHLPPSCFAHLHAVCKRFDFLMSSSRLWQLAFLRHFPDPSHAGSSLSSSDKEDQKALSRPHRFARLHPTTSWRKEYTLRTSLLRSLARGAPSPELSARHRRKKLRNNNYASLTYHANALGGVCHIDGSFPPDAPPSFIHGCLNGEQATTSDPVANDAMAHDIPVTSWNHSNAFRFQQHPYAPPPPPPPDIIDELAEDPSVMDISHIYGFVIATNKSHERAEFVCRENRSRIWLPIKGVAPADEKRGIPDLPHGCRPLVTALWIARSQAIPAMSKSSCGLFYGFANGFVAAYAVGSRFCSDAYFEPGDNTANWALSPGVPIVEIKADDCYTPERKARRRVWAVALNALGEVFYLKDVPAVKAGPRTQDLTLHDSRAWDAGRTARWELVEETRRKRKESQSSNGLLVDPDFCPRSYSDSVQNMDQDKIIAETQWINNYIRIPSVAFDTTFDDSLVQRTLLVDFGGNDEAGAGESVVVIGDYNMQSMVKRYTRFHAAPRSRQTEPRPYLVAPSTSSQKFKSSAHVPSSGDNWQVSTLVTRGEQGDVIASAIDTSPLASHAIFEDPMLMNGRADGSCGYQSIPGQRARFIALGDDSGTINIWDVRSQAVSGPDGHAGTGTLQPIRVIQTSSPWITCLALNSLYLVHGGPNGLVQAWDLLGSGDGDSSNGSSSSSSNPKRNSKPIRTIHSTFSPRMHHMLTYAHFNTDQVGGHIIPSAVCLDPDPTKLRGLVALGPWLRYWSFSNGHEHDDLKLPVPRRRGRTQQAGVNGKLAGKRWVVPKPTSELARFIQEEWEDVQLERETGGGGT